MNFFYLTFGVFFLSPGIVFSSSITIQPKVDSLLKIMASTSDDRTKAELYVEIASVLRKTGSDSIEYYAELGYDYSTKVDYSYGIASSLIHIGRVFVRKHDFKAADSLFSAGLLVIKNAEPTSDFKLLEIKAEILEYKGWAKLSQKEYYEALDCFYKALKIYTDIGEESCSLLLDVGYIHNAVEDYDLAEEYYNLALPCVIKKKDINNQITVYSNKGDNYAGQGHHDKALIEFFKSIELIKKHEKPEISSISATILYNIGFSQMEFGESKKALENFSKAEDVYIKLGNINYAAYCQLYNSKIRFSLSEDRSLLKKMKKVYKIAENYNDLKLKYLTSSTLAESYTALRLYKSANDQINLSNQLKDSIDKKDLRLKLRSLDLKSKFEIKQKIEKDRKEQELLETKLGYQNKLIYLLLGSICFISIGSFFLFRAYRQNKQVKEKLLINNEVLKRTEERLYESNEDMKKYIKLNKELEQFAYIASHDIKAPLRTIQGFSSILKKKFYDVAEERERMFFDYIEKGVKSLNLLINDLLEYSKSDTKALNIERVDFGELLDDVLLNLNFSITQAQAKIQHSNCDITLNADKIKIKQILQNLVSNAIKFRAADRKPLINIDLVEDESHYNISVKDNGIGIDEKYYDEVFEKFARLNTQDKYEGTGLGLSICSKYIKEHNGNISIIRNHDHGVAFIFTLSKNMPLTKDNAD